MLVLGGVVATGTVIESRYNSDLAKILVYQAPWFLVILGLLFTNISVATILRWPFQRNHTGFVITHIGLLTLLVGSMLTAVYGIDGSMRVVEGAESSQVMLPEYAIELTGKTTGARQVVSVPRTAGPRDRRDLAAVNEELAPNLSIVRLEPFVAARTVYRSHPTSNDLAIEFGIKSPFFDVTESLTSRGKPFARMGPALFRLDLSSEKSKAGKPAASVANVKNRNVKSPQTPTVGQVQFVDAKTGEILAETTLKAFAQKPITVRGLTFQVSRRFKNASVGQGGIEEKSDDGSSTARNPAFELKVKKGDVSFREVLFERFPGFSLHPEGIEGVKVLVSGEAAVAGREPPNDTMHGGTGGPEMSSASNEVLFRPVSSDEVELTLKKNGAAVLTKLTKVGDVIETPWMGMKLTLKSLVANAVEDIDVEPIEPQLRQDLPPAAVLLQLEKGFPQLPFYLVEGESRDIRIRDREFSIYFGRKIIELPFRIRLEKFTKVDYPGTETAMSYESDVEVNQDGKRTKISMNEPLTKDGFTLYQASFQMGQGMQTASIFSVNRDPGRMLKYLGSLIAAIGIVIYTLMRSRLGRKAKNA